MNYRQFTEDAPAHELALRIENALKYINNCGGIDGEHHKQWVLTRVVQSLVSTPGAYAEWVRQHNSGEDGPNTYEWDEGTTP